MRLSTAVRLDSLSHSRRLRRLLGYALGRGAGTMFHRLPADIRGTIRAAASKSAVGLLGPESNDDLQAYRFAPPGHFLSPIPSLEEVRRAEQRLSGEYPRELAGIELHGVRTLG